MSEDASHEIGPAGSPAAVEMARRQQRRLAVHQAAVAVLGEHPERASRALEVLDRWEATRPQNSALIAQWRRIIETRQWAALLEDSEHGDTLRKGSPFPFILDAEVRLSIIDQYSRKAVAEREAVRRLAELGGLARGI
jgi:hypothetical protein